MAFYADCTHEVKPLSEGYRVVLFEAARAIEGDEAEIGVLDAVRAHRDDYLPETLVGVVEHLAKGKRKRSKAFVESLTALRARTTEGRCARRCSSARAASTGTRALLARLDA